MKYSAAATCRASPELVWARSVGGRNVRGEKSSARGQFFDDSPAHGGSMSQEAAEKWTVQRTLQPGRFLPPTLLALSEPPTRSSCSAGNRRHAAMVCPRHDVPGNCPRTVRRGSSVIPHPSRIHPYHEASSSIACHRQHLIASHRRSDIDRRTDRRRRETSVGNIAWRSRWPRCCTACSSWRSGMRCVRRARP
jgi:hypothetical protein